MNKKYRAMQIVAPGVLEMTKRPIPAPGPDEVLIKIEACGVCGADLRDAERAPQEGQPLPSTHCVIQAQERATEWLFSEWVGLATWLFSTPVKWVLR